MPPPSSPKQNRTLTILKSAAIAVLFLVLGRNVSYGAVLSTSNKFVYSEVDGVGKIGIWTNSTRQFKLSYYPFSYVWFKTGTTIYTNSDAPIGTSSFGTVAP